MTARIESVAVIGAEIVGWSVAAALRRRLPYLSVTVVPVSSAADDLANRIVSTLPSVGGFHEDIGLTEADTIARAASAIRLGTRFSGWVQDLDPYLHVYGSYGEPVEACPFHQYWLKAGERGTVPPFQSFSMQAAMGAAGRMAPPQSQPGDVLQYGLQIDRELYLAMMTAFAQHLGVQASRGAFAQARLKPDGFVDAVLLDGGADLRADLFIDCSGPSAVLSGQLDNDFEDWGRWLPCDSVMLGEAASVADLPMLDAVVAMDAGWQWTACSPRSTSFGVCFSSSHLDRDAAGERILATGASPGELIALKQGRRRDPWKGNCVAVGAAAVAVEPLEWTNLHLVHSAVDRIVAMIPGRDCAPIELMEYNRQCSAEAERVRDFICLHYATAKRTGPFWEAAAASDPPDSLAHSLALFRERGRLPFYEEETFARDSWLAVLFGQGERPRRADPLADLVPPQVAHNAMSRLLDSIARIVPTLPTHEAHLQNLFQQAVR